MISVVIQGEVEAIRELLGGNAVPVVHEKVEELMDVERFSASKDSVILIKDMHPCHIAATIGKMHKSACGAELLHDDQYVSLILNLAEAIKSDPESYGEDSASGNCYADSVRYTHKSRL